MKRIGLLGGMSWESSAEYYRLINETTRDRCGGLHSADCLLRSVDFAEIEQLQREGDWNRAGERLAREAAALEAVGAEMLVLCTNTMHKVADAISAAITIPFIHIADTTAHAVQAQGLSTVGLLGTAYTMEQDFYTGRLRDKHGITVLVPDDDDRQLIHTVIYDELCLGVVNEQSRAEYRRIMSDLADCGTEGILFGCTEIDLLVGPADSPVPVFDTTACTPNAPWSWPSPTSKSMLENDTRPTAATFLFADIAGFTALTEAHGDEEAAKLVADFSDAVEASSPRMAGAR
jgi:aspartate racemase